MKKCIYLKLKMQGGFYCKERKELITKDCCIGCPHKKYKSPTPSKRTKELAISKKTKLRVWERDNHRCIFCGKLVTWHMANSHFIKRSHGGLGIEQNLLTNCEDCHHKFDDTANRDEMFAHAERYLRYKYNDFNIDDLTYKKN